MVVLLRSQWLEEPPEVQLAAWPLGLVLACPTSAWSAASCPAPPVSAVPITGLVCGGHPEPATEGIRQSAVVCQAPRQLFVCFCPIHCPPRCRRHLATGPLHSEPALPKAIQMQQLGDRAKWLRKIAPKASYLWCVLFCFVFSTCRCPRTKASSTAQLYGEMAWPCARELRQVVGLWRLLHAMGR